MDDGAHWGLLLGEVHRRIDRARVGDVGRSEAPAEGLRDLLAVGLRKVEHDHLRPLLREPARGRPAKAGRAQRMAEGDRPAAWIDLGRHRAEKVVRRWYAEACAVIDLVLGVTVLSLL